EGVTCSDILMGPTADILQDAVHFLGAVGQAYREDQEGYQNGIGIQLIAEQLHQPEKPDNPRDCYAHQQDGTADAVGIQIHEEGGHQYGYTEKHHYRLKSFDQIADQFAETDDMNPHTVAFK